MAPATLIVGLVGFAALMPVLVLGLVGGLLADRLDRRVLLLATQIFNASVLLLLAYLTGTGRATVGVILTFALVMGIVNHVQHPFRNLPARPASPAARETAATSTSPR